MLINEALGTTPAPRQQNRKTSESNKVKKSLAESKGFALSRAIDQLFGLVADTWKISSRWSLKPLFSGPKKNPPPIDARIFLGDKYNQNWNHNRLAPARISTNRVWKKILSVSSSKSQRNIRGNLWIQTWCISEYPKLPQNHKSRLASSVERGYTQSFSRVIINRRRLKIAELGFQIDNYRIHSAVAELWIKIWIQTIEVRFLSQDPLLLETSYPLTRQESLHLHTLYSKMQQLLPL